MEVLNESSARVFVAGADGAKVGVLRRFPSNPCLAQP
jgi:hypothetical protein